MEQTTSADLKRFQVTPWLDLARDLVGLDPVSLSVGPSGELSVLAVTVPADYRYEAPSGAIFPKVMTDRPHDFVIFRYDGDTVTRFDIREQVWNYLFVQPFPDDELLLVGARSRYFAPDTYDLNAKVFTKDGAFRRAFLLGDGIEDVQVTSNGSIWTSYSDEGIHGNFGWKNPVGSRGLVLWDCLGNRLYEFSRSGNLGQIHDCYALNVVSDAETWCCYYADFPLVRIRDQRIDATWQSPIHGSRGFAVWQRLVLFQGGYRKRDEYHLFELSDDDTMHQRSGFTLVTGDGMTLHAEKIAARGE